MNPMIKISEIKFDKEGTIKVGIVIVRPGEEDLQPLYLRIGDSIELRLMEGVGYGVDVRESHD